MLAPAETAGVVRRLVLDGEQRPDGREVHGQRVAHEDERVCRGEVADGQAAAVAQGQRELVVATERRVGARGCGRGLRNRKSSVRSIPPRGSRRGEDQVEWGSGVVSIR